jgi:hypothetical protein
MAGCQKVKTHQSWLPIVIILINLRAIGLHKKYENTKWKCGIVPQDQKRDSIHSL